MNLERKVEKDGTLILIVDDQIENIQVLGQFLRFGGYRLAVANSGMEAIEFLEKMVPDIILLDIMMPNMDGYEVCEKLKGNIRTEDIPIIFLTAKNLSQDVVKGFKAGGIDYVTKPFNHEELMVRIKTHIDLKQTKDLITRQNNQLRKLNDDKNTFLSIAAHDLRNQVNVVWGFSKFIIEKYEQFNDNEILDFINDIKNASTDMQKIISDMIDINALDEKRLVYQFEKFDLSEIIQEVIESFSEKAEKKSIKIFSENHNQKLIFAVKFRTKQVFENLLSNALKFSRTNKKIRILYSDILHKNGHKAIRVEIKDEGPGIKENEFGLLFTKKAKMSALASNNEASTGLGLAISKGLIEGMDGKIWCESEYGHGSSFFTELPVENYSE